jgi:hypothetical protein
VCADALVVQEVMDMTMKLHHDIVSAEQKLAQVLHIKHACVSCQ